MSYNFLHIFSDEKFVDPNINKFLKGKFDNDFIYLKEENKYHGKFQNIVQYVKPNTEEYQITLQGINKYDIIIIYHLDYIKANLINNMVGFNGIIIWNFFGNEIYGLPHIRYKVLSKETKKLIKARILREALKKFPRWIKYKVKSKLTPSNEVIKATKKVDYFCWYSKEEYEYLKNLVNFPLPEFLPYTITKRFQGFLPDSQVSGKILLGNSRSPYNNHIDILNLLSKFDFKGEVVMPFSYGDSFPEYTTNIKSIAERLDFEVVFVEKFQSYEDYINDLSTCSAAVYNSYRQLGLGNIFIALQCGLKVYLDERNPIFHWLNRIGFIIFSIEKNFVSDVKNQNLVLKRTFAIHNIDNFLKLANDNNDNIFFKKLINLKKKTGE